MYLPAAFEPTASQREAFLGSVDAGELVTATSEGLMATFLPVLFEPAAGEQGSFLGHLARANPQWQHVPLVEALLIARGPDAYITPSWYASKAEHGRVVPTWNYATAHVHGQLLVHDDEAWVRDLVGRLTDRHESRRELPWSVDDAPERFIAGQVRAIVGVELRVSRVQVKVKMSQNRPAEDADGVIRGLEGQGAESVARMVADSRRHERAPQRPIGPP